MSSDYDIKSYPIEPDYELLDNAVKSREAKAPQSAEISINIARPKRNKDVFILSLVACFLLLFVVAAAFFVISQSAVITTQDGKFALSLGKNSDSENPFVSNIDLKVSEKSVKSFDINDPPSQTAIVENEGELSISEIAKRVKPSVVSILTQSRYKSGLASGIIFREDGYIVTNYHVVEEISSIVVVLDSGERFDAEVKGTDERSDLAILKINAGNLPKATFGNSNAISVGDMAIAIGTPYNLSLRGTTTSGIISAINRDLVINNRTMSLIQTDASVNPGNSGGPLINKYGQIIGIISAKIGEDFEGLGFAIPMNTAKEIIEDLMQYGYVPGKPALGISGQFLNQTLASANNLPIGLYVTSVYTISDAYLKGLREGDVITAIDDVKLTDLLAYNNIIDSHSAGDEIVLTVYRDTNIYDRQPGRYFQQAVTLMDESIFN
jgi:serine protease Do